jgi:lipopolysaccharide transport system ATP-binding protein
MTTPDVAVVVDGVAKAYRHRGTRPQSVKESVLRPLRWRGGSRVTQALRDVSFVVPRGRTVGLVGPNGAGKSTLLRLIGGVGRPDAGQITVDGRIGAILEIGAAFHPELTGREAATLAGIVAGLTRREVTERLDEMVAFAGLDAFIDEPLRTYSTGMQARLGFSIAAHTEPDVLLVDEVLAVGDAGFQRRCVDRLRHLQRSGVTMLVVSHDHALVADICDEVVWLRGGVVAAAGRPSDVVEMYVAAVQRDAIDTTPVHAPIETTASGTTLRPRVNRFGSLVGSVTSVRVTDRFGAPLHITTPGSPIAVEVETDTPDAGGEPVVSVTVSRADGLLVLDSSSSVAPGRTRARLLLERFDAAPAAYAITVALYAPGWGALWDQHDRAYPVTVAGEPTAAALAPPLGWEREATHASGAWVTGWGA